MAKNEFEEAIAKLEKARVLQSTGDITSLLEECKRRQKIWQEYKNLRNQYEKVKQQLDNLSSSEKWLSTLSTGHFVFRDRYIFKNLKWSWVLIFLSFVFLGLVYFEGQLIGQFTLNTLVNKSDFTGEVQGEISKIAIWAVGILTLAFLARKGWKEGQIPYYPPLMFGIGFPIIVAGGAKFGLFMYDRFYNKHNYIGEVARWLMPSVFWGLGLLLLIIFSIKLSQKHSTKNYIKEK